MCGILDGDCTHLGVSKVMGVPWGTMENPFNMDDLGVPLFQETTIYNHQMKAPGWGFGPSEIVGSLSVDAGSMDAMHVMAVKALASVGKMMEHVFCLGIVNVLGLGWLGVSSP